jgi:hypothetical protein
MSAVTYDDLSTQLAIFLPWLVGWCVVDWLEGWRPRLNRGERLGLSWGAGQLVTAAVVFGPSLLFRHWHPGSHATILLAIPLAWLALRLGQRAVPERFRAWFRNPAGTVEAGGFRSPVAEAALVGLLVLTTLVVFWRATQTPLEAGDPLFMWGYRAKAIYLGEGLTPAFHARHESMHTLHHPPLLPMAEAWVYLVIGRVDEVAVQGLFPLAWLTMLFLVYGVLRRVTGRPSALGLVTVAATLPGVLDLAVTGYADLWLCWFTAGAFGFWLAALVREEPPDWRWIVLCLIGMAGVKNEGTPFVLALLGLIGWSEWRRTGRLFSPGFSAAAAVTALVGILPWAVLKQMHGLRSYELAVDELSSARLVEAVQRIPLVASWVLREIFVSGRWNVVGVLIIAALFWLGPIRRRHPVFWLGGAYLSFVVVLLSSIYLVVAVYPEMLMHASLSRVLVTPLLLAVVWLGLLWSVRSADHRQDQPV